MGRLLTKHQRHELLEELSRERSRRYADRIRVILLLDDGETYKDIAKFLFLNESSIANYLHRYNSGGVEGLIIDEYSGKKCRLSSKEQELLSNYLESNICLSSKEVIVYIEKNFEISYSVSATRELLIRLGFSYKKAKGIPGKANKELQQNFINRYNGIKPHGKVYFADSTHPKHNSILTYGWIKKGKDFNIFTNSGRFHLNICGAVDVKSKEVISKTYSSINKESICNFLKIIRSKNPGNEKIYFVVDGASYHKAEIVKSTAHNLNIKIVYLSPYSPNLNPTERLWKFYKKKVLYNKYYELKEDLQRATRKFFQYIRKYKAELETLLTDNFTPVGT